MGQCPDIRYCSEKEVPGSVLTTVKKPSSNLQKSSRTASHLGRIAEGLVERFLGKVRPGRTRHRLSEGPDVSPPDQGAEHVGSSIPLQHASSSTSRFRLHPHPGLESRYNSQRVTSTIHLFIFNYPGLTPIHSNICVLTMKLPPELLDEIIGQIPRRHLLHSCSFVTKSWTYLCQRHLFKTVKIHPGNLQKWLDNISPANAELLGHVRVLSYVQSWVYPKRVIGPADHTLREYFPSFRQLRHFNLNSTFSHVSSPLQQLDLSSAFQHTLSDISLAGCSTTKSAFVTLINYFPNLIRLHLRHINYHKEDEPVPPLSRLHLKKLSVIEWSADSLDLIDELSELGLNFEEVVVSDSVFPGPSSSEFSNRVVNAFGATTKCLRLLDTPRGVYSYPSVLPCESLASFLS